MKVINKLVRIRLTQEEIDSPLPIEITLEVCDEGEEKISYHISYPKK